MKAYISVGFSQRKQLDKEIMAIIETLRSFEIDPFVFIDNFRFEADEEEEMMKEAMKAIDNADILIAETSEKGVGIGVEVGYAKAKNKLVIYLRNKNSEHSTTVSGTSDYQVIYKDIDDLREQLKKIILKID